MVVDHGALDGMIGPDALNRANGLARQLWQEQNAGVQRVRTRCIGHHDRAGAAIALIAALFGAA
jgi:hypothetical protein